MNRKLIAAAVSAAVVAPVAAYGEVQVYGRINNAIDLNDIVDDGDSKTDISAVSSRFGIKYNKEMGNGLSAHGRYEFAVSTDKEGKRSFDRSDSTSNDTAGVDDLRIGTVGVSGPFGRVDIGQQWSAYFDTFGTLISPTYTLGYYLYSSVGGGPFRASNTIKYSNSFGPLYAELDVRLNEESSPESGDNAEKIRGDGIGLGLSWAVSDNITIAAAFDSEDGADGTPAVAATDGTPAVPQSADFVAAVDPTINANGVITDGTPQVGTAAVPAVAPTAAKPAGQDLPDTDRVGIAVKGTFGSYWVSVGWQNYEVDDNDNTAANDEIDIDTTFIYGGGKFGENTQWMLGYVEADDGVSVAGVANDPNVAGNQFVKAIDTDDSEQLVWAIYHNLGGGLKLYYEAVDLDSENKGWDGARHLIGMRVDF